MTEANSDTSIDRKVRRLSDAVRRVRLAEADRTDAFSDLHDAERARLAMLADEVATVFADLPADEDFLIGRISGGLQPRLWIDATAHVSIGRDRRTYRFVRDTRFGRVVIAEGADLAAMADRVTDYVAERVVERERIKDGDIWIERLKATWATSGAAAGAAPGPVAAAAPASVAAREPAAPIPESGSGARFGTVFAAALFGFIAGMATIIAYAWFRV